MLCLLLLILVVSLLLAGVIWLVQLSVADERAWHVLRVEGLVLVRILGDLDRRLVALILLLLLLLRLLMLLLLLLLVLLLWQALVFWAVALYPALRVITPLRVHSSEWGPIVLSLLRVGRKLLGLALVLHVFGRHLGRRAVFLLQEWVEVVLLLFVRGWQMRAGPLALAPLRSLQPAVLLRLLILLGSRVAAAD